MGNHDEFMAAGNAEDSAAAIEFGSRLESVRHRLATLVSWRLNGPFSPTEEVMYWRLCEVECELLNHEHPRERIEGSVNFAARTAPCAISFAHVGSLSTTEVYA